MQVIRLIDTHKYSVRKVSYSKDIIRSMLGNRVLGLYASLIYVMASYYRTIRETVSQNSTVF